MKKLIYLFLFLISYSSIAQEENRGTIKVEKKGSISSILFDNVNNRLIGKDQYGNILDSVVVSFEMIVTIKGIAYSEIIQGTTLSRDMQKRLERVDGGTKLFFTNIKVKEKNGTIISWPKFSTKLGFSYEKEE